MKKTIWKFELEAASDQEIELPIGAEILTVQDQFGIVCLWALVDPNGMKKETRIIEIFGTGHPIDYGARKERVYINTYQLMGGNLIFHVFECVN